MTHLDVLIWLSVACAAVRAEPSSKLQVALLKGREAPKYGSGTSCPASSGSGQSKEPTELDTKLRTGVALRDRAGLRRLREPWRLRWTGNLWKPAGRDSGTRSTQTGRGSPPLT